MKSFFGVLPELLKHVAEQENALCEGQELANPLYYLPISGPSTSERVHQAGYRFWVAVEGRDGPRGANVLINSGRQVLEVTIGEDGAFDPFSGLAHRPREVKRPDPIFLCEGKLVRDTGLNEALINEEGEDISLKFTFDFRDVSFAAEFVVEFLLNRRQPLEVKYM